MNDDEALLALAAGDSLEQQAAKEWLYDSYFERLLAALEGRFRIDGQFALSGAGIAFDELCRDASRLLDRLAGREGALWKWLLLRASSRARNERLRHYRHISGDPSGPAEIDVLEVEGDYPGDDPEVAAAETDESEHLRLVIQDLVPTLDEVDKHILLHDLVTRYELLTPEEAALLDDDYLSRAQPDELYTREQLKKRRQRLLEKLRNLPALRGFR